MQILNNKFLKFVTVIIIRSLIYFLLCYWNMQFFSYVFLFVNDSYWQLLKCRLGIFVIKKSYYDSYTFSLFYNRFGSEKAKILFTKYDERVISVFQTFKIFFVRQPLWQTLFYTILTVKSIIQQVRVKSNQCVKRNVQKQFDCKRPSKYQTNEQIIKYSS